MPIMSGAARHSRSFITLPNLKFIIFVHFLSHSPLLFSLSFLSLFYISDMDHGGHGGHVGHGDMPAATCNMNASTSMIGEGLGSHSKRQLTLDWHVDALQLANRGYMYRV